MQDVSSPAEKKGEKKRVTISIDIAIHDQGKQLAAADRRDFSTFLEVTIEERWKAWRAAQVAKEVAK